MLNILRKIILEQKTLQNAITIPISTPFLTEHKRQNDCRTENIMTK